MNEGIVFYNDGKLHLDTSMSQSAFAKSRMTERLSEKGFLAEYKDNSWNFTNWEFTGTYVKQCSDENASMATRAMQETVLLEGSAFEGKTLKNIYDTEAEENFSEQSKEISAIASSAVCGAIENAIQKNINLPDNGAEGIFISSDCKKIIFMPQELFDNISTCFKDENYSKYCGIYVYRTLDGKAALRFTECVIAYRALTDKFPFTNLNTENRQEDVLDHNFVKLDEAVYGLNEKLSFFIDNALMRSPRIESHKKATVTDKRSLNEKITSSVQDGIVKQKNEMQEKSAQMAGMKFPLEIFNKEIGLEEKGTLPSTNKLNSVERKSAVTKEQFETQSKKSFESFTKALNVKRWFRHNRTKITVVSCIVLVVGIIIFSVWNTHQGNPTTKSLTSTKTAEMFYTSMNNLDVSSAQSCVSGKTMSSKVDIISNFYVTSKSRSAYEPQYTCATPASWLCFNNNGTYTIFGLTQFTIDGNAGSLNVEGPAKKTHPVALTSENGKTLAKGDTVQHKASYYMVYTQGEADITVLKYTDTMTLTWKKDRWIITDLSQDYTESTDDIKTMFKDYTSNMESSKNDVLKTRAVLADKYTWISTEKELLDAKKKLEEKQF